MFDRLTVRNEICSEPENAICYINPNDPEGMYNILDLAECLYDGGEAEAGILMEISRRLAAYEDSGLSPEEVQKMARAKAEGRLMEVVRCGKCRHYNTTGCSDGCGWCENMDRGVFDEHYCSRGERREKE